MPSATGPIADLSYRTYEGVLDAPTQRWKVIARANVMRVVKNKWYWVLTFVFSGWYYAIMAIILTFLDTMVSAGGRQAQQALEQLGGVDWTAQFLNGFSYSQIWCLFIAIIAGGGAIANDNKANALLVYLSKPCTKRDYLWGKWMGVFVPLAFSLLAPALLFYVFGALNYRSLGFISDDPYLILRVIAVGLLGAAFHASLVLGVSSLFNQGRMASATYVGVYFITNFITVVVGIILEQAHRADESMRRLAESLYYLSVDGINIGVAKVIFEVDTPPLFMGGAIGFQVDRPSPLLVFGVMFGLALLALRLVWKRVRAVEVV